MTRRRRIGTWLSMPLVVFVCVINNFILLLNADSGIVWDDIRSDRMNAGVCPGSNSDLCSLRGSLGGNSSAEMCRCDDDCHAFGDCCIDHPSANFEHDHRQFACTEHDGHHFYTVAACDQRWFQMEDDFDVDIADFCTRSSKRLGNENYLQYIPVFSGRSRVMYQNVYCAICNGDAGDLLPWTASVDCNKHRERNKFLIRQMFLAGVGQFKSGRFIFQVPEKEGQSKKLKIQCRLKINEADQFLTNKDLYPYMRSCIDVEEDCAGLSSEHESDDLKRCRGYTAWVWDEELGITYKNYHCAVCNGINVKELRCGSFQYPSVSKVRGFKTIFSVNFDLRKDRCADWELYEPLEERCIPAACPLGTKRTDRKCVRAGTAELGTENEFNSGPSEMVTELEQTGGATSHQTFTITAFSLFICTLLTFVVARLDRV